MDETEMNAPVSGSETATQTSAETTSSGPSAANNYEGIKDDNVALDALEGEEDEGTDDLSGEDPEDGSQEPDPWAGYVDVEIDGKTFKVPEEFKDAPFRAKDYTQKAQALAEERRQVTAQAEKLERVTQITEQELNIRVELNGMASQIERYEQVDWDAFEQQDPMAAQSEWRKYQTLQGQFNRKYGEMTQAQTERAKIVEDDLNSRIAATTEFAYKNIPGMSPELDAKITQFAIKELGYDPDTLKKSYNPQIYKTLFLAHLGQQTLSAQKLQAKTPPLKKPPVTQPLTTVSAKTGSTGRRSLTDLASTDFEGYRAQRLAQLAKAQR